MRENLIKRAGAAVGIIQPVVQEHRLLLEQESPLLLYSPVSGCRSTAVGKKQPVQCLRGGVAVMHQKPTGVEQVAFGDGQIINQLRFPVSGPTAVCFDRTCRKCCFRGALRR